MKTNIGPISMYNQYTLKEKYINRVYTPFRSKKCWLFIFSSRYINDYQTYSKYSSYQYVSDILTKTMVYNTFALYNMVWEQDRIWKKKPKRFFVVRVEIRFIKPQQTTQTLDVYTSTPWVSCISQHGGGGGGGVWGKYYRKIDQTKGEGRYPPDVQG